MAPPNPAPIPTSTASAPIGLDPTQLALLQQFAANGMGAQTPGSSSYTNDGHAGPSSAPYDNGGYSGQHSPYANGPRDFPDRRFDDRSPPRRDDRYDDRRGGYDRDRGGGGYFRGGPPRDYGGRGGYSRGPPPPPRRDWDNGRRRSRSPPRRDRDRYNDSPGHQTFSPQRRDSAPIPENGDAKPAVDEFGRELRAGSDTPQAQSSAAMSPPGPTAPSLPPSSSQSQDDSIKSPVVTTPTLSQTPTLSGGLDQFDFATFDFTNPDSWTKLGKAWEVTNGRLPSQEELMMFATAAMSGAMMPSAENTNTAWNNNQPAQGQWQGGGRGGGLNRGGAGRGGFVGARGPYIQTGGGTQPMDTSSDAVVLGGGEDETSLQSSYSAGGHPSTPMPQPQQPPSAAVGGSQPASPVLTAKKGQMIKVGDKWKWVKAGDPLPSGV